MILIRKILKKDVQETGLNSDMKVVVIAILMLFGCSRHHSIKPPGPSYIDDCTTTTSLLVEGTYQNKNLYVQNPFVFCTDSISRFCAVSMTINDTIHLANEEFSATAFEIPLTDYHFKLNDLVRIVMVHYVSGGPKVLNPEVRMVR